MLAYRSTIVSKQWRWGRPPNVRCKPQKCVLACRNLALVCAQAPTDGTTLTPSTERAITAASREEMQTKGAPRERAPLTGQGTIARTRQRERDAAKKWLPTSARTTSNVQGEPHDRALITRYWDHEHAAMHQSENQPEQLVTPSMPS